MFISRIRRSAEHTVRYVLIRRRDIMRFWISLRMVFILEMVQGYIRADIRQYRVEQLFLLHRISLCCCSVS